MNCGDCGTKLIVISSNHGIVAFCPNCTPNVEKAFTENKSRRKREANVDMSTEDLKRMHEMAERWDV